MCFETLAGVWGHGSRIVWSPIIIWGFPWPWGYPKMIGWQWKTPLKWMMGVPPLQETSIPGNCGWLWVYSEDFQSSRLDESFASPTSSWDQLMGPAGRLKHVETVGNDHLVCPQQIWLCTFDALCLSWHFSRPIRGYHSEFLICRLQTDLFSLVSTPSAMVLAGEIPPSEMVHWKPRGRALSCEWTKSEDSQWFLPKLGCSHDLDCSYPGWSAVVYKSLFVFLRFARRNRSKSATEWRRNGSEKRSGRIRAKKHPEFERRHRMAPWSMSKMEGVKLKIGLFYGHGRYPPNKSSISNDGIFHEKYRNIFWGTPMAMGTPIVFSTGLPKTDTGKAGHI